MDMHCISQQVSDFLLLNEPNANEAGKDHVHAHISTHMLHPKVRIAVVLRQLLDLSGLLQANLVVHEGDLCTFDKANAELYLKVINQIMTLYKADTHGMLFAEDDTTTNNNNNSTTTVGCKAGKNNNNNNTNNNNVNAILQAS